MPEFSSEPLPPAYPATSVDPAGGVTYAAVEFGLPRDAFDTVPPLSQSQRVLNTFAAPSKTFADIRRNRSWWLPYLLLVVFSLLFGATIHQRVPVDALTENALRSNPAQYEKMQNKPAEQRAGAMKMTGIAMQVGIFSGPLSYLLVPAVIALLLWVGFNFILGGRSTYPGMFAVAMYAALPTLLFYLLVVIMLFVGDPETFNLNNPAATNAGYFLPAGSSAGLRSLLTSFDVFSLWQAFLLGLGGAIVARIKPAKGLVMVFAVWLVIVLLKAGFAFATS